MGGCFGNSFEDRHFEGQLMRYLDSLELVYCDHCGCEADVEKFEYIDNEEGEWLICPDCGNKIRI